MNGSTFLASLGDSGDIVTAILMSVDVSVDTTQ